MQNQFRQVLADPRIPLEDRVRMAASFGVLFSGLLLSGEAFSSSTNEELGDTAPPDPPRRPRRMTGSVRRTARAPSRLKSLFAKVALVATPASKPAAPTSAPPRAPQAPLHARLRHRRHRPQGQHPRRQGRLRVGPGAGPDDVPDAARASWSRSSPAWPRSCPRPTASRPASPAWCAAASSSALPTSSPRRARAPTSTPSWPRPGPTFDLAVRARQGHRQAGPGGQRRRRPGTGRHQGPGLRGGGHARHRLRHRLLHLGAPAAAHGVRPRRLREGRVVQRAPRRADAQEDRRQEVEQAGARR